MTKLDLIAELSLFQRLRESTRFDPIEYQKQTLRVLELLPKIRGLIVEHVPDDIEIIPER